MGKSAQILYLIVKNVLLLSFCGFTGIEVTTYSETFAPLIVGAPAIVLFLGIITIVLAGFFGWFNRQLSKQFIILFQDTLFLVFQILFFLFWFLIWVTYGNVNCPLEILALCETIFSFLPLNIIAHSVTPNNTSKAWEKGVVFDIIVTYIELITTLFDVALSFLYQCKACC